MLNINTRADLDAIAGTPAHSLAIRLINGTRSGPDSSLSRFEFSSDADFEAYAAAAACLVEKPASALPPPEPTLAEQKVKIKSDLAARRYAVETGGIEVSGAPISTDRQSQAMIVGAVVQLGADETVQWKGSDGVFRAIDRTALSAVARAVKDHVQACFAREAELSGLIDIADSPEDLATIREDFTSFWPASPAL
jgi:hypothetical protein